MEIKIRGEKTEITSAMKDYAKEKLSKLDKYLKENDKISANILFKVRGPKQKIEVTIPFNNIILRVEEIGNDFYSTIDTAIDKLERQIRKNKTRLLNKKNHEKYDCFNDFEAEEDETDTVIKRKKIDVKPMSEEEAILQMELLDHDFYFFKNNATNKTAVIYKRKEKGYGIIEEQ